MTRIGPAALAALITFASGSAGAVEATVFAPQRPSLVEQVESYQVAARRTCKSVSSCREAVELWCGGYRRADGDGDGIPCETVCHSKAEVDRIKADIGC